MFHRAFKTARAIATRAQVQVATVPVRAPLPMRQLHTSFVRSTTQVVGAPTTRAMEAPASDAKPVASDDSNMPETLRTFMDPADFYDLLKEKGIDFYTGVPDSLLKDFCAYITDVAPKDRHVIAANEGAAVGLATGYYLATKRFPVVYMQNSGFGNAINPLLSLCDPKIYSIPMLLLVGWRGEPGKKDEPQHLIQGKVMSALLTDLNIPFEVLPDYPEGAREAVDTAVHYLETRSGPYAFLVKRATFTKYKLKNVEPNIHELNREQALKIVMASTSNLDVLVTTTGFTSREVYELREQAGQDHKREFLTVGSMGHASVIALGIAIAKPSRQVFTIDGDGAMLMHMGSLATIGRSVPCFNFKHVLVNNGSHDSVGGQPTRGFDVDFTTMAKAAGYKHVFKAKTSAEIKEAMAKLRACEGPAMLEIYVNKGARKDLGRPKSTPLQNKQEFMGFLQL